MIWIAENIPIIISLIILFYICFIRTSCLILHIKTNFLYVCLSVCMYGVVWSGLEWSVSGVVCMYMFAIVHFISFIPGSAKLDRMVEYHPAALNQTLKGRGWGWGCCGSERGGALWYCHISVIKYVTLI